ncbi:CusA/CzcA family heavy metal efflux RND transporter [Persephonella sp. KM09-Lau-8]|uniref:efflux RND transporter permease subunit n=1 Tax=Persephonella sp. KM09-Lau-8 TaxID=1158345 RepID=UPI000495F138|nr:CusA/CzcA family heavy metal efflux RND transporter [Persephonella sp. KM09-Lau-8]
MIGLILKYRLIVLFLLIGALAYGYYAFKTIPVDTFPDPTPTQVNIYTEAPGYSAEEVEALITKKIETVMSGIKDVEKVRSESIAGLSYVAIFFKDGTDIYFDRRLVMEKLPEAQSKLPEGITPIMGPNSSGLGNVLLYALVDNSGKYSLTDLKTIQEWTIRPLLKSINGVEDIVQWGPEKAFIVYPNLEKLLKYRLTIDDIFTAIDKNGGLAGGGYTKTAEGDLVIRAVGSITSIKDIQNIPVKVVDGQVVRIKDVSVVKEDEVPQRRGAFTLNGREVQGNIVLKRIGTNTQEIVEKLRKEIKRINEEVLPEGVQIKLLYDQSYLTEKALSTIEKALIEGIILVSIAMVIFLGNIRAAILVILSIPFTLLLSFILMKQFGLTANLMSLGGLAIGLGLFADATVVVIENIFRHLSHNEEGDKRFKLEVIKLSVQEIIRPVVFAILIIIVVFLPIFSFESVEGKYFKPLALTIIFALISSLLIALVAMPVLAYFGLKSGSEKNIVMEFIEKIYHKILGFAFKIGAILFIATAVVFGGSLYLLSKIGTEFTPELDEGAVLLEVYLDPNISLDQSEKVARYIENQAKSFNVVQKVFTTIGRAEKGEVQDVNYMETWILLKPYDQWKEFSSRKEFEEALREKLKDLPAAGIIFTQPIAMRIEELLSGVKATVAIKIFGDDLEKINEIAYKVEEIAKNTKGAIDVETEAQTGKLQLQIVPKREILYRYGLNIEEILSLVGKYMAGIEVNEYRDGLISYPVFVKTSGKDLNDIEKIRNIPVYKKEDGTLLYLKDIADVKIVEGFFKIRHENGLRYALVQLNIEGRDLGGFIKELREKLHKELKLPEGYFIRFAGQFENQERAMKKLTIIVPVAIALIFLLLFINYNSIRDAFLIMLNVPFATIGGILALYISGFNLSVPASIGFIAVFGIATLNGVVLVSYIRQVLDEGKDIDTAIQKATTLRLRPILITATAASLGLVPILFTNDIGSEIQKPIAVVVIGGIFSSTFLTLILLPVVYRFVYKRFN